MTKVFLHVKYNKCRGFRSLVSAGEVPMEGHSFEWHTFSTIQRCHLCGKCLLGINRQGLQCKSPCLTSMLLLTLIIIFALFLFQSAVCVVTCNAASWSHVAVILRTSACVDVPPSLPVRLVCFYNLLNECLFKFFFHSRFCVNLRMFCCARVVSSIPNVNSEIGKKPVVFAPRFWC